MFSGGPLLFLIFISIGVVRAVPLRDFYNFSGNVTCLPPIDDLSQTIQLNPSYTFFGESFDSINVSENGNLSPNASFVEASPQMLPTNGFPLMAVFWGDVDTQVPGPRGSVCFQRTNDSDLVQKALADIQRAHPTLSSIDYLFISTWDHVGYYDNGTDKTNTFQSVLAVSGNETFVIYIYADNLIQWTNWTSLRGGHALVGYNAGHGNISYTVPTSMEEGIVNITLRTNVRRPGMCVFQVDRVVSQPQQTCADAFRGVEIQFEAATYTFSENSSRTEVCLMTLNDVRYDFIVTFEARLTPTSNDFTSSLMNITLEKNTTATCTNLTIHPDSIVEGNEMYHLNLTSNDPDVIINGDVSVQTQIVIEDSTVLELRFLEHPHAVSERIGNMKLCLRKVPGTEVAPDVTLNVTLVEFSDNKFDGSAFDLPITPFTFLSNNSEACLDIRVINDTTAQGNRSVSLGVKSQDSQFLVNGDVTNITFLDEQDFLGCKGEDDEWGIAWLNTKADSQATSQCRGGMATRVCHLNMTWAVANASSCRSESIDRVLDEALSSLSGTNATIESATRISGELSTATQRGPEISLLPSDLKSTNNIVERVLVVLERNVDNAANSSEALVDVFNNVLSEANQAGWTQLQTAGSGSQTLLENAERFGRILASIVNGTSGNTTLMFTRENIFVAAERVNSGMEIVFPARSDQLGNFSGDMNETVQISIPAESLLQLTTENSSNGAELYFVNIIFRNIGDFLPTNTTILNNARAESLVLSTQLGRMDGADIPADIVNDNPITLSFNFTASAQFISQYLGVFWNFSDPVGSGGWSSEGIQVISSVTGDNVTTVVFNSTHLTSFAVLVDVAGGLEEAPKEEKLALKIVSYIGCIISMVCLSITVIFYLTMGKKLFSAIHYFVHLNLALTLLVGYLVFVLGIELGNSNKVACGFVAALLQYLFLSAFCWMMCEGIMLYLMLIVVFSRLSKKWWFFMIVGYCPPLLFVASGLAARVEHYGVYGDDGELAFCWLSIKQGSIFAFVAPMVIIIMINTVFLVLAVKVLIRSKSQARALINKEKSINKAANILKATVILLPLLGVTWLFGLLTLNSNTTVFAWLFTIFNSLQGLAIFAFHVIRSTLVWNTLTSMFKKKPKPLSKEKASSSSDGQHSTNRLKELLHKKPLDTNENISVVTSSALFTSVASESVANDEVMTTDEKGSDYIA